MSINCPPAKRSCEAVAGLPLIHARLLPWLSTVRRSSRLSSASKPASLNQGCSAVGQSNSALTSVRAAPSRTAPTSALAPSVSCSASIKMDLPAPVSPVSAVKPLLRSKSSACTITKSRSVMRFKAIVRSLPRSSVIFCAACQNNSSRAGAKSARNILSG